MKKSQYHGRIKRKFRIRKKISGCSERPRLSIFKSNKYLYAQIIDDASGATLVSASTFSKEIQIKGKTLEAAKELGKAIAEKAIQNNINTIVFDRSGYIYHGRIKAIAEAAREAGLRF